MKTTVANSNFGQNELHKPGCAHTRKFDHNHDIDLDPVEWTVNDFVAKAGSKDAFVVAYTREAFYADAPENGELAAVKVANCIGSGRQTIG